MTGAVQVRRARPDEAAEVVRLRLACWREAYRHLLSEAFLSTAEAGADEHAERLRGLLERGGGPWVAEVDGALVGLARAVDLTAPDAPQVDHEDPDDRPTDLVLTLLYVLQAHHGSGVGQALLDVAVGDRPCHLWVAEDNPRARAFYTRNGFRPDGARRVEPEWEDMAIVRLLRAR